jgi:hypothetical protein
MKNKEEIKKILPNKGDAIEQELKQNSPRIIMKEFEEAITEKYKNFLSAFTTETSKIDDVNGSDILSYSFYLVAFIGKGYNYKLFEVIPKKVDNPYPVEFILFQNFPHNEGEINSAEKLQEKLFDVFKSSFTHNVINNLIAQVELYNESRTDGDILKDSQNDDQVVL